MSKNIEETIHKHQGGYLMYLNQLPLEKIISKLKQKRNEIIQAYKSIKEQVHEFWNHLVDQCSRMEQKIIEYIDKSMLEFFEKVQTNISMLEQSIEFGNMKRKGTLYYGKDLHYISKLLAIKFTFNSLPNDQLAYLLQSKCKVLLTTEYNQEIEDSFFQNIYGVYASEQNDKMTNKKTNMSYIVIYKLYSRIYRYMLNEYRLHNRIRTLEMKRGMKDVSKSKLEESEIMSQWKIARVQYYHKILIEEISKASEKIIELNGYNSFLRAELKKYCEQKICHFDKYEFKDDEMLKWSLSEQKHSKEYKYKSDCSINETISELKMKNKELERYIIQLKEDLEILKKYSLSKYSYMIKLAKEIEEKHYNLKQLDENYVSLNHDYELSIKKKYLLENELSELKKERSRKDKYYETNIYNLMKLIELKYDQVVASMNNVNAAEERVQRNISKYERIIQNIEYEKKNLIQKLECINEKQSSEDAQWKNYTNEEITKLRKYIQALQNQYSKNEECIYYLTRKNAELTLLDEKQKEKIEAGKKYVQKIKKYVKYKYKLIEVLKKNVYEGYQNKVKLIELEAKVSDIRNYFMQYRENCERKLYINYNRYQFLKERCAAQLVALSEQEKYNKVIKKSKGLHYIIEKYMDSASSMAVKNGQIKQLKEYIRVLKYYKATKELKYLSKKRMYNPTCQYVEADIHSLSLKILKERICSYKYILSQKLLYFGYILAKYYYMRTILYNELARYRIHLADERNKNKILSKQSYNISYNPYTTKKQEEKIDKLYSDLKNSKAMLKKCQNYQYASYAELKLKKYLIVRLKDKLKESEEATKTLQGIINGQYQYIYKIKRSQKYIQKKEVMFKELKGRCTYLYIYNESLKKEYELSEYRQRNLSKQLLKKEETIRYIRITEDKYQCFKDDARYREMNYRFIEQKEIIRKQKNDLYRKDECLEHYKKKTDGRIREIYNKLVYKERYSEKLRSDLYILQKKCYQNRICYKKEESKTCLFVLAIKRLFELFIENMTCEYSPQKQEATKNTLKNASGYSNMSNMPKNNSPIGNNVSVSLAGYSEAWSILQIPLKDISKYEYQLFLYTNQYNKTGSVYLRQSTFTSPKITKHRINTQDHFLNHMEYLDKILKGGYLNINSLIGLFKKVIPNHYH